MTVQAVLFDLDGTLVELAIPTPDLLDRTYSDLGIEPPFPARAYHERRDELAGQFTSKRALRRRCFVAAAEDYGHDARLGREIAKRYSTLRETDGVRLRPAAAAVLRELARTRAIGVVTNGAADEQRAKIDAVGIDQWLDAVVVAGDQPPAKPAPDPFEDVLEELDASPADAVMVGDSISTDVVGATAAGIRPVLLEASEEPASVPCHDVIGSLAELTSLVGDGG